MSVHYGKTERRVFCERFLNLINIVDYIYYVLSFECVQTSDIYRSGGAVSLFERECQNRFVRTFNIELKRQTCLNV